MPGHLVGGLLAHTRPDRPEPHRLAVAQREPFTVRAETDEPGLTGLLLVQRAQVERSPLLGRMPRDLERPGPSPRPVATVVLCPRI